MIKSEIRLHIPLSRDHSGISCFFFLSSFDLNLLLLLGLVTSLLFSFFLTVYLCPSPFERKTPWREPSRARLPLLLLTSATSSPPNGRHHLLPLPLPLLLILTVMMTMTMTSRLHPQRDAKPSPPPPSPPQTTRPRPRSRIPPRQPFIFFSFFFLFFSFFLSFC